MRIVILSMVNIKHMSLISLYTNFFKKHGIDYDIIYVDKYNEEEIINAKNIYRYEMKIERNWHPLKKVLKYVEFRNYANKIIKENNYDFLIIWRTETALLFVDSLIFKFKNKYCLNIRDYANEKNKLIYLIVKKIIKNAKFNTISSEGFKSFLPNNNYITVNSFNKDVVETIPKKYEFRNKSEPIRICFIGYVRFYENDKKLIDAFANDDRYYIQFFGSGSNILKEYSIKKEVTNIEFSDGFKVEETYKYLMKADVINNLYGRGNVALDTAISIKYYYALYLNLPILVYKNTYMEKVANDTKMGFIFDEDYSNLANDFYEWYHKKNIGKMIELNGLKLEKIKNENSKFNLLLHETFR